MSLLELPNEIVYMITAETRLEGFEAFVLSCKRVFQLAGSLLQQHNQFKEDLLRPNENIYTLHSTQTTLSRLAGSTRRS